MISGLRSFAKSKWAVGLLGLLALSLLVTGSQMDIFGALGPRNVIEAGDRSMNTQAFTADFERVRSNIQEESGRPVTIQEMAAENLHLDYLQRQTQRLGFLAWAWGAGIRPGDALIHKQIRAIPAFFNQVTGKFDEEQYQQLLAQQNVTPAMLEQDFRDQYITQHFGQAMVAGVRPPRVLSALLAAQGLHTRDARWFQVTQAMAGTAPAPTDAQLTAFMNENAAQLRRPEFRAVALVLFNSAAGQVAAPTEAQIQERFEFRKAALSQPERRSYVTITAPTREAAARAAAALRAGQTPEQAARAADVRPATFTDQPQAAIGDRAVGQAVFGMTVNQVSEPIQAGLGFTVAQLTGVTPGQAATLDSARAAIIDELRGETERAAIYARVERFEAARNAGKTFAQAVTDAGARIVRLPPFTQDGRLPNGQPLPAPPQVVQTAYALAKGGESEIVDVGQGQYFALRVEDVSPAAMPQLADVRDELAQAWTRRENQRLLSARADALAAQVRNGQDIAAVAASAGASLVTRTGIVQNQANQAELGQGVLAGVFGQGRGQIFTGQASETAFVVGRVDAVRAPAAAPAAALIAEIGPRLGEAMGQEMANLAIEAAANKVGARHDVERARQALNLTDTPATPAGVPSAPTAPAPR